KRRRRKHTAPGKTAVRRSIYFWIVFRVGFAIQGGWDQDFFVNPLAVKVIDDRLGGGAADSLGKLHGVSVDLAFLNGLLAFRLAIEANQFHLICFAGLFQSSTSAQNGR